MLVNADHTLICVVKRWLHAVEMPQYGAMASKGVDCALETLKEFTDEVVLAVVHEFHLRKRHWQLVHIDAQAAGVWPVIPWRPGLSSGVQHVVSGRSQM